MAAQYVGVCGATSVSEVEAIVSRWRPRPDRSLALGLLVARVGTAATGRHVAIARAGELLSLASNAEMVLHMQGSLSQVSDLLDGIMNSHPRSSAAMQAVQLNRAWPPADEVHTLAVRHGLRRVVLQVGGRALRIAGGRLVEHLRRYEGAITDVLLDASGGAGRALDLPSTLGRLEAILDAGLPVGIGVAGGLEGSTISQLAPLWTRYPKLSVDAEGRLRNADDQLDLDAVDRYLRALDAAVPMGLTPAPP